MTESIRVYRALKQDIITCELSPGTPVSEAELCQRYGASRTPVREACRQLKDEALLQIIPFRGYFIAPLTISEYRNLHEVQLVIDPTVAGLAAERASSQQIREIESWSEYEYHAGQKTSYCTFLEWNRNFHSKIAEASGNDTFVDIVANLQTRLMRYFYQVISMDSYGHQLVEEHRDIARAVKRRNPELARQCAAEHVRKTIQRSARLNIGSMDSSVDPSSDDLMAFAPFISKNKARLV
jgi:DNA-binding GntR family transcriptional regulator